MTTTLTDEVPIITREKHYPLFKYILIKNNVDGGR